MRIEYGRDDSDEDGDDDEEEMFEGWEDALGQREFPGQQEDGEDHDQSWEDYDECDFEDVAVLEDPEDTSDGEDDLTFATNSEISDDSSQHSFESEDSSVIHINFSCPLCKGPASVSICSTPCGHMFCTPCIFKAYKETGVCPVKMCHTAGEFTQLRKFYLSGV